MGAGEEREKVGPRGEREQSNQHVCENEKKLWGGKWLQTLLGLVGSEPTLGSEIPGNLEVSSFSSPPPLSQTEARLEMYGYLTAPEKSFCDLQVGNPSSPQFNRCFGGWSL